MAHLRPIVRKCPTCGRNAVVELLNRVNAVIGYYCRVCGRRALTRQQALERGTK